MSSTFQGGGDLRTTGGQEGSRGAAPQGAYSETICHVANLPYKVNEDTLMFAFGKRGERESAEGGGGGKRGRAVVTRVVMSGASGLWGSSASSRRAGSRDEESERLRVCRIQRQGGGGRNEEEMCSNKTCQAAKKAVAASGFDVSPRDWRGRRGVRLSRWEGEAPASPLLRRGTTLGRRGQLRT
eukprot:748717-Hanusia_phi.AAC.2